jgi:polysaccharide export outer membrane protein
MRTLLLALASLSLAACASSAPVQVTEADIVQAEAERVDCRLGSGDQVRLIVFDEEGLSGEFIVDGAGRVSLPLVGEVGAGGLTLPEFESAVVAALSDGYLNDPRVSAEVLNFRPFYILGEVEAAGEYPYTDGLTVMNAVATAGGFTYRANRNVIFIKRAGQVDFVRMPLTAVTAVQPGDTIRVGERFF